MARVRSRLLHQIRIPTACLLLSLRLLLASASAETEQCSPSTAGTGPPSWDYSAVFQAPGVSPLPGFTRSTYERDHALITPESRVWSTLPGWKNTHTAHLISPSQGTGAKFAMFLAEVGAAGVTGPLLPGVERLVVVLGGAAALRGTGSKEEELGVGSFVFMPPGCQRRLESREGAQLLVYEQLYHLTGSPKVHVGSIDERPLLPVPGEVFRLRKLLPATAEHDFNIHVMDFAPGEFLNVKEVHYNQHGLLLVQGQGIYRLGEKWYPVTAGDAIYMAPYVCQWYAALGNVPSRYILYKDTTVDPLFSSLGMSRQPA